MAVLAAVLAVALAGALWALRSARRRAAVAEAHAEEVAHEAEDAAADAARSRRAADRAALALDAVPSAVVIWDKHGTEAFRNHAARAFAPVRHAEALAEQAVQELLHAALAGRPATRTLDLFGPPAQVLVVAAAPLPGGAGAVAVVDDVTERRRLEAVRRDFVANMSHEIKTPVGALGVLAETLVAEEEPATVRRLAERMTDEAMRVGRIIDDLLALSRIEAEEAPVREPVLLVDVVAEAAERIRSIAEASGTTIDAIDVDRRHLVRGDRRQLVSAVANLLENACKYGDPTSPVQVRSTASETGGDGWIELAVQDHGIGIPTLDLERVFERFYRVDRARSRVTGGTGLGLAIVRHIAASHGGEVRVDSREGEGSTFTLQLPSAIVPRPAGVDRTPAVAIQQEAS